MANEENLKPFNKLTENEQRKIAQKGGKASGKSRRKRKTYAEMAKAKLNSILNIADITLEDFLKVL